MNDLAIHDIPDPLSEREKKVFTELESEIEQNLRGFKRVGYALSVIRDQRLYRIDYDTFEEYCREAWDLGRPQAYRLIDSYNVVENLSPIGDKMSPMGDKDEVIVFEILPENEAQARPLASLSQDQQIAVWQMVIDIAKETGCKITAELVQRCVSSYQNKKLSDLIKKTRKYGERSAKVIPEEVQVVFHSLLTLVQRNYDSQWQEVGKKEFAAALREILQAIEE